MNLINHSFKRLTLSLIIVLEVVIKKHFQTFDLICVYDINFTNIAKNETVNLTISDKNMNFFELKKKLKIAPHNGFIFNQIIKFTLKIYSSLPNKNIQVYLNSGIPIMHKQFFKKLSQNQDYVKIILLIEIILFICMS